MTPIFVSFFTLDTPYESEAAELAVTLRQFDLPHDIKGVPALGSWVKNCGRKPTFILDMMLKYVGLPVVWVDADARIRQLPTFFNTLDCDVAFHRRRGELLSGTLYFSSTDAAWETVELWQAECSAHPDEWDQRCLDAVVKANPGKARFGELPASYVRIFDADDMGNDVVIEHMQASRRLRGLVA